jgi:hypothetical protein
MFPIKHSVHHRAITGLQAVNPQVSPKGIFKYTERVPRHSTPKASPKGMRKYIIKITPKPENLNRTVRHTPNLTLNHTLSIPD